MSELAWETPTEAIVTRTPSWWHWQRVATARKRDRRDIIEGRGLAAAILDTYDSSSTIDSGLSIEVIMYRGRSFRDCC